MEDDNSDIDVAMIVEDIQSGRTQEEELKHTHCAKNKHTSINYHTLFAKKTTTFSFGHDTEPKATVRNSNMILGAFYEPNCN